MSKPRFIWLSAWRLPGLPRWISGRPPTGRTRTRSLEMSVTDGATTTWTSWCSSSHITARICAVGGDAAVGEEHQVGAQGRRHRGRVVEVADHRHTGGRLDREVVGRGHRAEHLVAQPGLALEDRGDLVDRGHVADDDDLAAEVALTACPLHDLAQRGPLGQQQWQADEEGVDEEPAGEGVLGEVAGDARPRRRRTPSH